jgi:hypothetical protein
MSGHGSHEMEPIIVEKVKEITAPLVDFLIVIFTCGFENIIGVEQSSGGH